MKFKNQLTAFRRGGQSFTHISPFSGWALLIVAFCLINIIQLGFIVHSVMGMIYGEQATEIPVVLPTQTVERGRLGESIQAFAERQREYESLRTLYVAPDDPSR